MSDSDGDTGEFVFYGTALTPSETLQRRHELQKTDVKDASAIQGLPVWKQVHFRIVSVNMGSSARRILVPSFSGMVLGGHDRALSFSRYPRQ